MDKRSLVIYLSGLAAAGAVVGLAASCSDQPRIKCTAGHGAFAAVYTPVGGGMDPCGMPGEEIGVEAYNYPLADGTNLDPNRGSLGMQPLPIAEEIGHRGPDPNTAHKPFALGDWATAEPTADNFCTVTNPNEIQQDLAAIPAVPPSDAGPGEPFHPSLSVNYKWSNVRFYNTPAAPGNQLVADLVYTRQEGPGEDGGAAPPPCTATYRVVGLWPVAHCDADPPATGIDETKCSPFADPAKNRPTGSGISPDIATKCDPVLQLCVLAREPPSFK